MPTPANPNDFTQPAAGPAAGTAAGPVRDFAGDAQRHLLTEVVDEILDKVFQRRKPQLRTHMLNVASKVSRRHPWPFFENVVAAEVERRLAGHPARDAYTASMHEARASQLPRDADPLSTAAPAVQIDIAGQYGDVAGSIHILVDGAERVMWDCAEWVEDPSLVYVIANAIHTATATGDLHV